MTDAPFPPNAEDRLGEVTEEELRAAYEAEMKRLRVEDVVVQTVVSLMNLGARRAGLVPGSEDERDPAQVQMAIEGARVLLPLIELQLGPNAAQLREALSQLQLAYAQMVGEGAPATPASGPEQPPAGGEQPAAKDGEDQPGPAQKSGRLWVPGQ